MRSSPLEFLRQRFTRVTSSVAFIPQIDGLRALAVLMVIGHHVFAGYLVETHRLGTQELPRDWSLIWDRSRLVPWGLDLGFGVQIFFVISGFVLALPFARSALERSAFPSTGMYLLRRLIRLEPPYVLSLTLLFLWIAISWDQPWWHFMVMVHIFRPHYLASLVYMHGQIFKEASWINGNTWTLEIEVQFYLLMPLIARLFSLRKNGLRRLIFVALIVATALAGQLLLLQQRPRFDLSIAGHLEYFLAGVLLADIYLDPPRRLRLSPLAGDLCALLSAGLLIYLVRWRPWLRWTEAFWVASLFLGIFHGRWAGRLFALRWLTVPGTMCYTIYLYHAFIIQRCMPLTVRLFAPSHALWFDTSVQMLLMLPPVLLVSAILYLTTERPFIILSHRATRRWRSSPVPAAEIGAPEAGA